MPMTNGKVYYNPTFDEVWERDFLAYLDEKTGAKKHWNSLIFGGDPSFLTRMAFLALDVPIDTISRPVASFSTRRAIFMAQRGSAAHMAKE